MGATVLVPLCDGFEEIEAVTIIDVLRRADLTVTTARPGGGIARGSRSIRVEADADLRAIDLTAFDAIVLPGGMGGTIEMLEEPTLLDALREQASAGRLVAAICAAPMVLAEAGLVAGVPITSHPSVRDRLGDAEVVGAPSVVRSGRIWTSQGPGTAMDFALALVGELAGPDVQATLTEAMIVTPTTGPA